MSLRHKTIQDSIEAHIGKKKKENFFLQQLLQHPGLKH